MAVAHRSSSIRGSADTFGTSVAIPVPSGAVADDIVIAFVGRWLGDQAGAAITAPAGFTLIAQTTLRNTQVTAYWKRLSGSDSGSYTFSWTGSEWANGNAVCLSGGLKVGSPIEDFAVGTSATANYPTLQVDTVSQPYLAWGGYNENADSTTDVPDSYTSIAAQDYGTTAWRVPGTTGSHSATGATAGSAMDLAAILVAVQAEPASGSNLTVRAARSATRATRPALTQVHPLTVRPARSATRATRPALAQAHDLAVRAARAQTRATRPLLAQASTLVVRSARSTTRSTRPLLGQVQQLVVRNARAQARATRPLLGGAGQLVVRSARAATRATRPLLAQTTSITVRAARASTRSSRPLLAQQTTLVVRSARAAGRATRPLLGQSTQLLVRSARAATRATRVLLTGQGAEPVKAPTRVVVTERRGDVLLDVPGPVLVDAPSRAGTAVAADRRGLVSVTERFGTVEDMT